MKHSSIYYTILLTTSLILWSCEKYDDSELRDKIQNLENRIENIEKQIQVINTSINSIQTIINVLQTNKHITKIENLKSGYILTFSDNSQLVLNNGKDGKNGKDAPVINVRWYNGYLYWTQTIDGVTSWLKDINDNMIPATGMNGITPLLNVDSDGYWIVSYDSGNSFDKILDLTNKPIKARAEENNSYFDSFTILNNDLTITLKDGTELSIPIGKISPYKAIDLGLSVLWSSANYGATSSDNPGGLYLWGDVNNNGIIAFYDAPNTTSISGSTYDIVRKNLGNKWRTPTRTEQTELISKCIWTRSTLNGVLGMKVTGLNGNSIFLPPTGYALPKSGSIGDMQIVDQAGGYYWTGDSHIINSSRFAYYFYYNNTSYYYNTSLNTSVGKMAIRPVREL